VRERCQIGEMSRTREIGAARLGDLQLVSIKSTIKMCADKWIYFSVESCIRMWIGNFATQRMMTVGRRNRGDVCLRAEEMKRMKRKKMR